jgi:L,D-peptidoglycan transpeptidase YkuD (ErfK/YbiS/YcfS/YnhG family)
MKQTIIFLGLVFLLSGCNLIENKGETEKAATVDSLAAVAKQASDDNRHIKNRKRVIVGLDATQDVYILYGQELLDNKWTVTFDTILCTVGYNGIAKKGEKREGDGKTPAGTYELGAFFGYENDLGLDSNFIELEPYHYWMSDASSPAYNTLIDYDPSPLIAEKMERDDHLYKYGIIVNYNVNPAVPGMGSAIFLHIYRSPEKPTAGCVAIAENKLVDLIYWLQNAAHAEITISE